MGQATNSKVTGQQKMEALKDPRYEGKYYKDLSAADQYAIEQAYDQLTSTQAKGEDVMSEEARVEAGNEIERTTATKSGDDTPVGATSDAPDGPQSTPSEGPQNLDGDASTLSPEEVKHGQGD